MYHLITAIKELTAAFSISVISVVQKLYDKYYVWVLERVNEALMLRALISIIFLENRLLTQIQSLKFCAFDAQHH